MLSLMLCAHCGQETALPQSSFAMDLVLNRCFIVLLSLEGAE
jgi:hypothetical protein